MSPSLGGIWTPPPITPTHCTVIWWKKSWLLTLEKYVWVHYSTVVASTVTPLPRVGGSPQSTMLAGEEELQTFLIQKQAIYDVFIMTHIQFRLILSVHTVLFTSANKSGRVWVPGPIWWHSIWCTHCCHIPSRNKPCVTSEEYLSTTNCAWDLKVYACYAVKPNTVTFNYFSGPLSTQVEKMSKIQFFKQWNALWSVKMQVLVHLNMFRSQSIEA